MANILLADDDAANLDLVRRTLAADGHAVTTATDGSEALEALQAAGSAVALLVADIDMPGLDGITLAEQARATRPGLRILLMSGFADQLDRAKALESSGIRTLSKPFTLEQIRGAVRGLLT
jgi:CheY-like chemotaxis protein